MTPVHEWAVFHHADPLLPHRTFPTEWQAKEWLQEWADDGGRIAAFSVAHRVIVVGAWESVPFTPEPKRNTT